MSRLQGYAVVAAVCAISAPPWLAAVFRAGAVLALLVDARQARNEVEHR